MAPFGMTFCDLYAWLANITPDSRCHMGDLEGGSPGVRSMNPNGVDVAVWFPLRSFILCLRVPGTFLLTRMMLLATVSVWRALHTLHRRCLV